MKGKILGGFMIIIVAILMFFVGMDTRVAGDPIEVYQVYLHGEKIGYIYDKQELYDLIDSEQGDLKEQYNVDKVYPPDGLDVKKVYTYDNDIIPVKDIYNIIKDKEPFTFEGYTVTITYKEETKKESKKLYLLNKDDMKVALYNVAAAFIGQEDLADWENDTQSEIVDVGEIITSVYFDETITIKEDLVSTKDSVFRNVDELSQYLLFGMLEQQKTYIAKAGENLETIAEANKLNVMELLIANPQYPSENVLLTEGEELNVGLINPVVSVVYRKTIVEDLVMSYETEIIKDSTKYTSYEEETTKGEDGLVRFTRYVIYKNGEVQDLVVTDRVTLKNTVNRVITQGTKRYPSGGSSGGSSSGPTVSITGWGWPTLQPYIITSSYGYRWGTLHRGVDISGTGKGSPIYSATDGVVEKINKNCSSYGGYLGSSCGGGHGNYAYVRTTDGYLIYYSHMTKNVKVKEGDTVKKGQVIGYMGNSGSSTGTHLHFQVQNAAGSYINPCKSIYQCKNIRG